jgi:hypothetical protein
MIRFLITITIGTVFSYCTSTSSTNSKAEVEIRAARQASNQAIANHDSVAIAEFWTEGFSYRFLP